MRYVDILFPLNLKPLTYRCPDDLLDIAKPGMLVSAYLKKRLTKGIIFSIRPSPPSGRIRDIHAIFHEAPVFSQGMLRLIRWMSDYYIAHEGIVLKQTVPGELFEKVKARGGAKETLVPERPDLPPVADKDLAEVTGASLSGVYRAILFFQLSMLHEYSLVCEVVQRVKNVIVILPEIMQADLLFSLVRYRVGNRACILHSGIARGRRSAYIEGIISGNHDIVIGTRMALFSPMQKPSLFLVLQENSSSYKLEEGLQYNIRDVAVMRGYLEHAAVVLSSVTPSLESYFNVLAKKYASVIPREQINLPSVRVINMRFEKQVRPQITKTAHDKLRQYIRKDKRVLFVLNRRGYATLLQCRDCGHIEKCSACGLPLVYHKNAAALKCHSCGMVADLLQKCRKCKGHNLEFLGSGTQKVQEDIEVLFGIRALRFDSDRVKGKSLREGLMREIASGAEKVIIGTKILPKKLAATEQFPLAAVLNIDSSLGIPDFRASERAYMEVVRIAQLVDPEGEILIQTRFPDLPLFRHLKNHDYPSFAKEELLLRKAMHYPPYSKMVKVMIYGCSGAEGILRQVMPPPDIGVEVLGPVEVKDKRGKKALSLIMKSDDRKALNSTARAILAAFEKEEGCEVRVDVDPL